MEDNWHFLPSNKSVLGKVGLSAHPDESGAYILLGSFLQSVMVAGDGGGGEVLDPSTQFIFIN